MAKPSTAAESVIAHPEQAAWGRREIAIAEHEMPGLMSIRRKYAKTRPPKGARLTGSRRSSRGPARRLRALRPLACAGGGRRLDDVPGRVAGPARVVGARPREEVP